MDCMDLRLESAHQSRSMRIRTLGSAKGLPSGSAHVRQSVNIERSQHGHEEERLEEEIDEEEGVEEEIFEEESVEEESGQTQAGPQGGEGEEEAREEEG